MLRECLLFSLLPSVRFLTTKSTALVENTHNLHHSNITTACWTSSEQIPGVPKERDVGSATNQRDVMKYCHWPDSVVSAPDAAAVSGEWDMKN